MAEPGDPPASEDPTLFDDPPGIDPRVDPVVDPGVGPRVDPRVDEVVPADETRTDATPAAWSPARIERHTPSDLDHAHDDLVGFTSASSLTGARRAPVPDVEIEEAEPDMFDAPLNRLAVAREARVEAVAPPVTSGLRSEVFGRSKPADTETRPVIEGPMGLFSVYALILFAVPTLGLAAVIALVAITVRPQPQQPLARSHFEFQKRTLWIAAISAIIGAVLIIVNLGVFVLFIGAVWLLARGAWGLLLLAQSEPIARPHQWLIAAR